MISNHEEDEFVAVRVQDPRVQNEGSWNSYVDYKLFLHTNSKAFTAKTSCVRRRYSEFVWLRKKLQKNAGLVPVPDLPGKSFFSFSNEDFLERRRKGLQVFLDKVTHTTVCLSDSQLHLFLQTQLPVGHIQDCVQGHTPYSVTDAILTYASSNRGLAQAQEDDANKEPSLTVSYESMESPAPHQPCLQTNGTCSPELLSCGDSDPLEDLLERPDHDPAEILRGQEEKPSIRISQKSNQLEAVVEDCGPTEATFYLGGSLDKAESISPAEQTQQQKSCQIETPVEVHSPIGTGFEDISGVDSVFEEESVDTEEKTAAHLDAQEDKHGEKINCESEECVNSVESLDLTDKSSEEQVLERDVRSQEEDVQEDGLENHISSEVNEGHVADGQIEPDNKEEMPLLLKIHDVITVAEVESGGDDTVEVKQEVDVDGTKDESDEDSHSLPSSNESIVKVSDEESICEEGEDSIQAANGYVKTSPEDVALWSEVDVSSRNILDLHMNGGPVEKEDISAEEDVQYTTNISSLSKSPDRNSSVTDGDLTENSDFSILETSCVPELADSKCTEQEALSSLSLDTSEETEVH